VAPRDQLANQRTALYSPRHTDAVQSDQTVQGKAGTVKVSELVGLLEKLDSE
jgi:hypothetical protein